MKTLFSAPTRNVYGWPPFILGWVMLFYHLVVALSLAMDSQVQNLIVLGGLDKSIGLLGRDGTILMLVAISLLALLGLVTEYRVYWLVTLSLILPQYFVIAGGAGSHLYIFLSGEYAGRELSRWVLLSVLGLFFSMAVGHTWSVVWRIRYWMLVSQFRSEA